MAEIKSKNISIKSYLSSIFITVVALLVALLGVLLGLGIPYILYDIKELFIALCITGGILFVGVALCVGIGIRNVYKHFYTNLVKNTMSNIDALTNDKRILSKYNVDNIQEFQELNDKINRLAVHNATLEITSRQFDYTKIPLEYINKKDKVINESSLKKNIREIIYCSYYLRNALMSISYDTTVEIDESTQREIISTINKLFVHPGVLTAIKEQGNGYYVYLPAVESFNGLKSMLNNFIQRLSVTKKSMNGIELISPKIDVVVFPFSQISDIFSDLHYSERQDDRINIYLPKRFVKTGNDSLFEQTVNVSNINRIISQIYRIRTSQLDFDQFLNKVEDVSSSLISYYNFDQAGIILYDADKQKSGGSSAITLRDNDTPLFPKDRAVSQDFIDAIVNNVDPDFSFFFSRRKNVPATLGKQLDIYGISSGFFYEIRDLSGAYLGIVYFINLDKKECPLDNYMQQSLAVYATLLSSELINNYINQEIIEMKEREQNLLKLTNVRTYTIDKTSFKIQKFSPSLKKDIPELEVGQICYKTMFGFEKPCSTCPLVSKQKAIKKIRGFDYEVSSVLTSKSTNNVEVTLADTHGNNITTNRFDKDYLINSHFSFIERLNDLYNVQARGYLALLRIENTSELVEAIGSEGFAYLIRCFTKEINKRLLKNDEIYLYKNNTIAVIFSQIGKLDAISRIETIYNISKQKFIKDGKDHSLKIHYDITKYPQEHANTSDFIKHLEVLTSNYEKQDRFDLLYVEENNFVRPASKEEYILDIINQSTITKNIIIKSQPIVNSTSRAIFAAELLIRLSDQYNNSLLNTEEVISVAAKNGKLSNISDILIDYIGSIFRSHGISIFKAAGFEHMSINADFNYFKDESSIAKIVETIGKYRLPKNFLIFEITENEIANHYDSFKDIVATLKRNDIIVVCDRYYGKDLSFEKLKDIGIANIKTDRTLVSDIDVNDDKYNALKKLLLDSTIPNINITLVGVENGQQYKLIKDTGVKCNLQGYYFHHPLSSNELVEAIRADNIM